RRGDLWGRAEGASSPAVSGRTRAPPTPAPPPPPTENAPAAGVGGSGGTTPTAPRRRSARLSAAAAASSVGGRAAAPAPVTLPPYNPFAAKARERSAGGTVTLNVGRDLVDSALESPFDYLRDGLGVAAARRRSEQLRKLHLGAVEAEGDIEEVEEEEGAGDGPAPAVVAETKTRRGATKRALDAEESPDDNKEDEEEEDNEDNTKKAEPRPKRQAKEETVAAERPKRRK
ncbi:hypothetical protein MAPG_03058, partial [Magnaporthiopsis poae ATCC 64411]